MGIFCMYYHPLFFCIHIYKNIYVDIYIYIQGVVLQIAFSYRGSGGFDRGLVLVFQRWAATGRASEGPDLLPYAILGELFFQNKVN